MGTPGLDGTGCTSVELAPNVVRIDCGDGSSATLCGAQPTEDFRNLCQKAGDQLLLAGDLEVEYATRSIANHADQFVFWPHDSTDPTHLVFCIESDREELADGRLQPSLQSMALESGEIRTLVRGMMGCDGTRTTPWGTLLATEEFADDNGAVYELLFDPAAPAEYSITERGANGEPATIVDESGSDASSSIVKRVALPSMSWEGLLVLPSGVVIGGDELRPGSGAADSDGGALFKFIPAVLRSATTPIAALAESPLGAGSTYTLRVSCTTAMQFGQGCEIGNGSWVPVRAATARPDADAAGATGYYRPEDLELDPHFAGPGIRFCVANTGSASASNFGEILCAVDSAPDAAPDARSVVINRLLEGDSQLNQPDNFAFHPTVPGLFYVIEDNSHGDVWSCLPDGADRDIKSDGCVRLLSVRDPSAEPTGFILHPDGSAYVSIQHSADGNMPLEDGYATDDILLISGFAAQNASAVAEFGVATAASLSGDSVSLFGFGPPLAASVTAAQGIRREATFPGGAAPTPSANGFGTDASAQLALAGGVSAKYLTRVVANSADQGEFWPPGSAAPQYLVFCIEGDREEIAANKLNPSVQAIALADGSVRTILRGMQGCDGLRVSPWGTLLATEEFADDNGGVYEILWDPASSEEYSITERGGNGAPATIVDSGGNDATHVVDKRTALPSMAWEGILVTAEGVVIGGDELRPGSATADADGGALFKFLPATPRLASGAIAALTASPLVAGTNYAMRVSCTTGTQFGQGCEIGNAAWVPVGAATARPDAEAAGATGYYRPEDLQRDPNYTGPGVRFCFANTGSASARNYGEVLCAVDSSPLSASPTQRSVVVNRFLEGDPELNQPDNIEIQEGSGIVYVIEDNGFGDVWACLPDGADRDLKTDGCARLFSVADGTAEPTGFILHPDGTRAYVSIQHSADPSGALVDDYATDDIIEITGFAPVSAATAASFGGVVAERLRTSSSTLFGFSAPLAVSAD